MSLAARDISTRPIDAPHKPAPRKLSVNERAEEASSPRVLVVDDDPSMRLLARATLEKEGYMVKEAKNGEDALALLTRLTPDLIMLDVMMPGIDGFAVCQALRAMPGKELVPVMMITGLGDVESINRGYKAGATDFVAKPINWPILARQVYHILEASATFKNLLRSESKNRALLNAIPDLMICLTGEGTVVELRSHAESCFLDLLVEPVGKSAYEILPGETAEKVIQYSKLAMETEEMQTFECEHHAGDTTHFWDARAVKSGSDEALVIFRDITQKKQTEKALMLSEERYALASLAANDGLWDWDLSIDEVHFSPRWKSMLGYAENETINSMDEWFSRVHEVDLEQLRVDIKAHLENLTSHFENEHRMLHKDGSYRWMLSRAIAVRDINGKVYRMTGSQTDISERKRVEEQLLHDALYDSLTGLPNRTLFMDRLSHALKRTKRAREYSCAVLFIDLDRFKVVNDSLGHMIGDALLVAIARRLERFIRSGDTVARIGGDEFVMLFDDVNNVENAKAIAERVLNLIAEPFTVNGIDVFTTASMGIALSTPEYQEPEDILRDADITMYRAKALGKARYELFDTTIRQQAVSRLHLETDLRSAVENKEFCIHYQPIVSFATGKIDRLEALVRWEHPYRGLIPPAEFIPLAEETGLIVQLGEWILRHVCRQIKTWQDDGLPVCRIAVNVSSLQLKQQGFLETTSQILRETGVNANCIEMEITETILMDRSKTTVDNIKGLKTLGINICLDDFGTGYSSLSYLQHLPVDVLKIDRSFIQKLDADMEQTKIIDAMLALGKNLGIEVIAEGIETTDQLNHLKGINCFYGQGFLFSRPVDSNTIRNILAAPQDYVDVK